MLLKLGWEKFELENGISIELKPLDSASYQKVLSLINSLKKANSDSMNELELQEFGLDQISNPELLEIAQDIIPKNSRDLKGIQIENEDDEIINAKVEDLFNVGALIHLILPILFELFHRSSLQKEESEELKKPLQEPTQTE